MAGILFKLADHKTSISKEFFKVSDNWENFIGLKQYSKHMPAPHLDILHSFNNKKDKDKRLMADIAAGIMQGLFNNSYTDGDIARDGIASCVKSLVNTDFSSRGNVSYCNLEAIISKEGKPNNFKIQRYDVNKLIEKEVLKQFVAFGPKGRAWEYQDCDYQFDQTENDGYSFVLYGSQDFMLMNDRIKTAAILLSQLFKLGFLQESKISSDNLKIIFSGGNNMPQGKSKVSMPNEARAMKNLLSLKFEHYLKHDAQVDNVDNILKTVSGCIIEDIVSTNTITNVKNTYDIASRGNGNGGKINIYHISNTFHLNRIVKQLVENVNPEMHNVVNYIVGSEIPNYFIHGTNDHLVKQMYLEEFANNFKPDI